MANKTNVPAIQWTVAGPIAPSESAILAGVQADLSAAYGVPLSFTTTSGSQTSPTAEGQLATSMAAVIGNANSTFLARVNAVDPAFAVRRDQDAIGRLYFQNRIPSQPTVIQVICTGLAGVPIPLGASVQDGAGNIYLCTTAGVIGSGGTVTLPFANVLQGPIAVPGTVSIYQAIGGWDSAAVSGGQLGRNVENRAQFEQRRQLSVASNSKGMGASIQGDVLALPGVMDCYYYQNQTGSPLTVQGVTLAPFSIYIGVTGGNEAQIAQAIFSKKQPCCPCYVGNTSYTLQITDGFVPPYPEYTISWDVPTDLNILVAVNIVNSTAVPVTATTLIQNAIIGALAGADGGQRARQAGELLATRFYQAITSPTINDVVNPFYCSWAQIISIQIGSTNAPGAVFTGSILGTTLNVTDVTSGTVAVGQTLFDTTGNIIPGTYIYETIGGSGGIGTYGVSNAQTVGSETISGVTPNLFKITPKMNQIPSTLAALISVTAS